MSAPHDGAEVTVWDRSFAALALRLVPIRFSPLDPGFSWEQVPETPVTRRRENPLQQPQWSGDCTQYFFCFYSPHPGPVRPPQIVTVSSDWWPGHPRDSAAPVPGSGSRLGFLRHGCPVPSLTRKPSCHCQTHNPAAPPAREVPSLPVALPAQSTLPKHSLLSCAPLG